MISGLAACRLKQTRSMAEARRRELSDAITSGAAALGPLMSAVHSQCQRLRASASQLEREQGRCARLWEQLGLAPGWQAPQHASLAALLVAGPQAHDARCAAAPLAITLPFPSVRPECLQGSPLMRHECPALLACRAFWRVVLAGVSRSLALRLLACRARESSALLAWRAGTERATLPVQRTCPC